MSSSGTSSASSGFVLQWRKFAFFDKTLVGDPASPSSAHKEIQVWIFFDFEWFYLHFFLFLWIFIWIWFELYYIWILMKIFISITSSFFLSFFICRVWTSQLARVAEDRLCSEVGFLFRKCEDLLWKEGTIGLEDCLQEGFWIELDLKYHEYFLNWTELELNFIWMFLLLLL